MEQSPMKYQMATQGTSDEVTEGGTDQNLGKIRVKDSGDGLVEKEELIKR